MQIKHALCERNVIAYLLQDPGDVPASYDGPLSPGWLHIQWVKINNLTDTLIANPYYTQQEGVASGGGFGLRSVSMRQEAHSQHFWPSFQDDYFSCDAGSAKHLELCPIKLVSCKCCAKEMLLSCG